MKSFTWTQWLLIAGIAAFGCQPQGGDKAAAPAEEATPEIAKGPKGLIGVPSKGAEDPKVVILESSDFQ